MKVNKHHGASSGNRADRIPLLSELLTSVRVLAGPFVDVWDDPECGCYRATCRNGYAFDNGVLHELIGDYSESWQPIRARIAALRDLESRFATTNRPGYTAAPCTDPNCEWCQVS